MYASPTNAQSVTFAKTEVRKFIVLILVVADETIGVKLFGVFVVQWVPGNYILITYVWTYN